MHPSSSAAVLDANVLFPASLRDLLLRAAEADIPYHIETQHPDAFLVSLYRDDDMAMVRVVREQAAALRHPSLTFEQVLDVLAQHVPRFVALVRSSRQADP